MATSRSAVPSLSLSVPERAVAGSEAAPVVEMLPFQQRPALDPGDRGVVSRAPVLGVC